MEELITIENLDDILGVMANTPITNDDETCFFFAEKEDVLAEDIDFIHKDSASDTEIALAKFLIEKEYKKYKAGLAIKMWINWDDNSLSANKKNIFARRDQIEEELEKFEKYMKKNFRTTEEDLLLKSRLLLDIDLQFAREKLQAAKEFREQGKGILGIFGRNKPSRAEKLEMLKISKIKESILFIDSYLDIMEIFNANVKAAKVVDEKIVKKIDIDLYKGLKYEKCVYSFITENIIKPGNISPNFIPLIAAKSCPLGFMIPFFKIGNKDDSKGLSQEKVYFFRELAGIVPGIKLNFMITGTTIDSTRLKSLEDMMPFFEINLEAFEPVLFQVVYSLAVMEFFGIVHNDLHFGNIMIQELTDKVCMRFKIGTKTVDICTQYIVKFFDWDRGYIRDLGDNLVLQRFSNVHQVNNTRTKQDFSQFLCGLSFYRNIWTLVTTKFLTDIIPEPSFYYFRPFSSGFTDNVIISNEGYIKYILRYLNGKHYTDSDRDIDWIEVDKKVIINVPPLMEKFRKLYPRKDISSFNSVYIGVDKNIDTTGTLPINIYFSSGWHCQSLFDISDSVLRYPTSYIKSSDFLRNFNTPPSVFITDIREYTFPSVLPTSTNVCSYDLNSK